METLARHSLVQRMIRAAMLKNDLYEEVEADGTALGPAALVVVIVAFAQAIGASGAGLYGAIMGIAAAIFGWLIWSGITYLIGSKLLGGTADWGELLRTIGFAQSPGVLYLLAAVPLIGNGVRIVVSIWVLVAVIIAIRQALDFSTWKAVATAVLGWLVLAIPMAIFGLGTAY